jgi:hypothetical protein
VTWVNNVLVIAGLTAESDELHEAMIAEAGQNPAAFVLVVPRRSSGSDRATDADRTLRRALARAVRAGLHARGMLGDVDPVTAAVENFDPWCIDKIIVCTLPTGVSRWCGADVPARIRRLTGAPVVHVKAAAPGPSNRIAAAARSTGRARRQPPESLSDAADVVTRGLAGARSPLRSTNRGWPRSHWVSPK